MIMMRGVGKVRQHCRLRLKFKVRYSTESSITLMPEIITKIFFQLIVASATASNAIRDLSQNLQKFAPFLSLTASKIGFEGCSLKGEIVPN